MAEQPFLKHDSDSDNESWLVLVVHSDPARTPGTKLTAVEMNHATLKDVVETVALELGCKGLQIHIARPRDICNGPMQQTTLDRSLQSFLDFPSNIPNSVAFTCLSKAPSQTVLYFSIEKRRRSRGIWSAIAQALAGVVMYKVVQRIYNSTPPMFSEKLGSITTDDVLH